MSMYQKTGNSIQRARLSKGLTQEALAERCGYSADSVRAWESGARTASMDALGTLAAVLDAQWLPAVYLREQTEALSALIPTFEVGRPLAEAAAAFIGCVMEFMDGHFDRKLLRMVADGHIDAMEAADFAAMMELAARLNRAYYELMFAERKEG